MLVVDALHQETQPQINVLVDADPVCDLLALAESLSSVTTYFFQDPLRLTGTHFLGVHNSIVTTPSEIHLEGFAHPTYYKDKIVLSCCQVGLDETAFGVRISSCYPSTPFGSIFFGGQDHP